MIFPTTITEKWQMTIPKQVRKTLGLKRPGRAVLSVEPKQKMIAIHQPPSLLELAGTLTPKNKKNIINAVRSRELLETSYERV